MALRLLALLVPLALSAAEPWRLEYAKSFPGSNPPYIGIRLEEGGKGLYMEKPDDDQPVPFQLAPTETAELMALVEKLDHFGRPLESGLKVANMGEKTYRYAQGKTRHEVKFNYSLDESAKLLQDWFERITESQLHYLALERSVRFDKLGVNKVLLQLQITYDRKRLVSGEQFLPLLERVAKNDTYLNMARERASALAQSIRDGKPKAE